MDPRKLKAIEDKILAALENPEPQYERLWRCSGLGTCKRKQYWARKDEPVDPDYVDNQEAFDVGNAIHIVYQDRLVKGGKMLSYEQFMSEESLSGHCDGLINVEGLVILDLKSTAKNFVPGVKKNGEPKKCLTEPEPWHQSQVYGYQKLFWDMGVKPLVGAIVYLSKDNRFEVKKRVFAFPLTDDTYQQVADEIKELDTLWEDQTLPPAKPITEWDCKFCQWANKCKLNG